MKFLINSKRGEGVKVIYEEGKFSYFEKANKKLVLKKEKTPGLREKIFEIRNIIREAKKYEIENLEIDVRDLETFFVEKGLKENVEFVVTNLLMASYEFDVLKASKKDDYKGVQVINFIFPKGQEREAELGVVEGQIVGTGVNEARTLSNLPANIINPITLADYVKEQFKGLKKVKINILVQKDLEKMKAGGILAVSAGSAHEPRLISIEYSGGGKKQKPIVLVGKGVTHDNGGINLKPASGGMLEEMHLDMSGASAVIHAVLVLAKLKVNKNVIAVVPAVENSVSGLAYRPGDILTMMSGKTVEVLNTDAEGRIILADALTYVQSKFTPECIIDVATLTGAALVAVGQAASPLMSNDDMLAKKLQDLGNESTGDFLWRFPIWDVYKSATKNKRADLGNIPETSSRYGGSINGAMFLKEFINEGQKWAHIDMASRMTSILSDNLAGGAMGETVRLFVRFVRGN